jgi:hypothetical protein
MFPGDKYDGTIFPSSHVSSETSKEAPGKRCCGCTDSGAHLFVRSGEGYLVLENPKPHIPHSRRNTVSWSPHREPSQPRYEQVPSPSPVNLASSEIVEHAKENVMDRPALERLANLLRGRNSIDEEIARVIGRPALSGHISEWIAAQIFDVKLHASAVHCGSDGCFAGPPFEGRTVNVKMLGKREGILDLKKPENLQPDFYLVLAGPKAPAVSSRGGHRPFVISEVFLFEAALLVQRLTSRRVQIGVATSITAQEWEDARIYPDCDKGGMMRLRPDQVSALRLFGCDSVNRAAPLAKSQFAT